MRRPQVSVRRVLETFQRQKDDDACRRCGRKIEGTPVWDVNSSGRRVGPYHGDCAPSVRQNFRDRMERK